MYKIIRGGCFGSKVYYAWMDEWINQSALIKWKIQDGQMRLMMGFIVIAHMLVLWLWIWVI